MRSLAPMIGRPEFALLHALSEHFEILISVFALVHLM